MLFRDPIRKRVPSLLGIFPSVGQSIRAVRVSSAKTHCLFPSRVNWLADQERRIRTGTRTELLCASIGYLGDIEISFLIHAHPMRVEQSPRKIAQGSPGIN